MCNKQKKPNCRKTCKECDMYDKNLKRIMEEESEIDYKKCRGRE